MTVTIDISRSGDKLDPIDALQHVLSLAHDGFTARHPEATDDTVKDCAMDKLREAAEVLYDVLLENEQNKEPPSTAEPGNVVSIGPKLKH